MKNQEKQCCQNFLGENPISHAKNPTFCDFFIPPPKIAKNLTPLTVFIAFFLTNAAENFNFGYLKNFICRICFSFMVFYLKKNPTISDKSHFRPVFIPPSKFLSHDFSENPTFCVLSHFLAALCC